MESNGEETIVLQAQAPLLSDSIHSVNNHLPAWAAACPATNLHAALSGTNNSNHYHKSSKSCTYCVAVVETIGTTIL